MDGPAVERGAVAVRDGRITAVGVADDVATARPGAAVTDLGDSVLMPGLVNLHTHLEYTALGPLFEERPFHEWLPDLGRRARAWTPQDWVQSARQGAALMLASGITSLGDIVTRGPAVEAMRESGLGGTAYIEILGARRGEVSRRLESLRARYEQAVSQSGERVHAGISPHAVYTLSGAALAAVAQLAEELGAPLAIHLAETQAEVELVMDGAGPLADLLEPIGGHELIDEGGAFIGPIALAHRYRLLGRRTVAAHCTNADAGEIRLLCEYETSVALCPRSNKLLRAGEPPVAAILAGAVRAGIGADSLASNERFDLFEELRLARDIYERQVAGGAMPWARATDPAAWLRLITIGGAESMGLQGEIGALTPGKYADMVALECDPDVADPQRWVLDHARAAHVTYTWTSGVVRYAREGG